MIHASYYFDSDPRAAMFPTLILLAGWLVCFLVCAGYGRYYKSLEKFLLSRVDGRNKLQLIPKEDPGVTGNFEVTVVGSGQVLHSKKQRGQGRAESDKERLAILEQILPLLLNNNNNKTSGEHE